MSKEQSYIYTLLPYDTRLKCMVINASTRPQLYTIKVSAIFARCVTTSAIIFISVVPDNGKNLPLYVD